MTTPLVGSEAGVDGPPASPPPGCNSELEWSEFSYICQLARGHSSHHRDTRFGRFEWREFGDEPAAPSELRIATLDGWHLRGVRVPGGGIIVTLERVLSRGGMFPLNFSRRISEGQARELRDWLDAVL